MSKVVGKDSSVVPEGTWYAGWENAEEKQEQEWRRVHKQQPSGHLYIHHSQETGQHMSSPSLQRAPKCQIRNPVAPHHFIWTTSQKAVVRGSVT